VTAPDSYVDLSAQVDFAADDLYEPADRVAASGERAFSLPVFWVVVGVLTLPTFLAVVYPRLDELVGPIPARTLTAVLVGAIAGYAVVRLISVPRVAQIVSGGAIVVLIGAMLAVGTPFTAPLLDSDSRDRTQDGSPKGADRPRSVELAADYTTLNTLGEQHAALRRRLIALAADATMAKLDAATSARRRVVDLHAPGHNGAAARADAREWAAQLRACRVAQPTRVWIDSGSLICR
jgi:hypothetical protein